MNLKKIMAAATLAIVLTPPAMADHLQGAAEKSGKEHNITNVKYAYEGGSLCGSKMTTDVETYTGIDAQGKEVKLVACTQNGDRIAYPYIQTTPIIPLIRRFFSSGPY
jgi:hypothetical protein